MSTVNDLVLDENNKPVKKDKEGELVITTLGIQAMPLLRFKTGDIVKAHYDTCKCGRNTTRLGPVVGRKKQMIKYKGTTIFPPAMYDLLNDFTAIKNYIIVISKNEIGTDKITIKLFSEIQDENLLIKLKDHFRAKLRVSPIIEFVSKEAINKLKFPKTSRKPMLFIDQRENNK